MKQNNQQRATANKIKKWIQATKEVEKTRLAIPITRLTSIKRMLECLIQSRKQTTSLSILFIADPPVTNNRCCAI